MRNRLIFWLSEFGVLASFCVLFLVCACAIRADEPVAVERLIGKWTLTQNPTAPAGLTSEWEFTKTQLIMRHVYKERPQSTTYKFKLDADKLEATKFGSKEPPRKFKVTKLTDKELVVYDEIRKEESVFKKSP